MKPHPRIRKTIKWGGAAVTVLLVVVWIGSGWISMSWSEGWHGEWKVDRGCIADWGPAVRDPGWHSTVHALGFDWRLGDVSTLRVSIYQMPIPLLVIPVVVVTFTSWWLDTLARRRALLNLCPKCNYDRAGIGAGAVCPECGSQPAERGGRC